MNNNVVDVHTRAMIQKGGGVGSMQPTENGKKNIVLRPLHTRAKGRVHVIGRAVDSHPKAVPLIWSVKICIPPTSSR